MEDFTDKNSARKLKSQATNQPHEEASQSSCRRIYSRSDDGSRNRSAAEIDRQRLPERWRSYQFVGTLWLQWLDDQKVGYVVRIKKNTIVGRFTAEQRAKRCGPHQQGRQSLFRPDLEDILRRLQLAQKEPDPSYELEQFYA